MDSITSEDIMKMMERIRIRELFPAPASRYIVSIHPQLLIDVPGLKEYLETPECKSLYPNIVIAEIPKPMLEELDGDRVSINPEYAKKLLGGCNG